MAPWASDGTRTATSVFETAAYHMNVKIACRCGHALVYEAHCLWRLFDRKGWNDSFYDIRRRFYCKACRDRTGRRVRPMVEATREAVTVTLPWPTEAEWKRAGRRVR